MKKIEIMGCGYIGLPTAITFTLAGYEVCGFDVKDSVVETLNAGHIHIVEPGLQDAMTKAMNTGRLHFTTKPEQRRSARSCRQAISACSSPRRLPTPRAWWRGSSPRPPALRPSSS